MAQREVGDPHEPSPGSVRVRAEHGGVKVNVMVLERDRLRRAQPTSAEQLKQRAVAQRGWSRSARLGEQLLDFLAGQ